MISIVIPTMKSVEEIEPLKKQIIEKTSKEESYYLFASCKPQSAAKNRNDCIDAAKDGIIIMLDDDIQGFYPGWVAALVTPLLERPDKYSIVAARTMTASGSRCPQLGDNNQLDLSAPYVKAIHTDETQLNIVGSACIAFVKDSTRFNEGYWGATYEDSDFCMEINKKYPNKQIIINNACKLIHNMEAKGRGSNRENWIHNKILFTRIWGWEI